MLILMLSEKRVIYCLFGACAHLFLFFSSRDDAESKYGTACHFGNKNEKPKVDSHRSRHYKIYWRDPRIQVIFLTL